jgi:hypothetical protein
VASEELQTPGRVTCPLCGWSEKNEENLVYHLLLVHKGFPNGLQVVTSLGFPLVLCCCGLYFHRPVSDRKTYDAELGRDDIVEHLEKEGGFAAHLLHCLLIGERGPPF